MVARENLICVVTVGLLAAQPAMALSLAKCNRAVGGLGYAHQHSHTDHGGGVVSQVAEADVNGDAARVLTITACASGRQISAQTACEEVTKGFCADGTRRMSAPDATIARLRQIAASPEAYSFDQLKTQIASVALRTRAYVSDRETCGCRAAYPGLRKGKIRFKMEPAN